MSSQVTGCIRVNFGVNESRRQPENNLSTLTEVSHKINCARCVKTNHKTGKIIILPLWWGSNYDDELISATNKGEINSKINSVKL